MVRGVGPWPAAGGEDDGLSPRPSRPTPTTPTSASSASSSAAAAAAAQLFFAPLLSPLYAAAALGHFSASNQPRSSFYGTPSLSLSLSLFLFLFLETKPKKKPFVETRSNGNRPSLFSKQQQQKNNTIFDILSANFRPSYPPIPIGPMLFLYYPIKKTIPCSIFCWPTFDGLPILTYVSYSYRTYVIFILSYRCCIIL